jgi:hypothetical protein
MFEHACGKGPKDGVWAVDPGLYTHGANVGIGLIQTAVVKARQLVKDTHSGRCQSRQPLLANWLRDIGHHDMSYYDDGFDLHNAMNIAPYIDYKMVEKFQPLYKHYVDDEDDASPFRQVDRIRLVQTTIGRHLNLQVLKHSRIIADYFALHDMDKLKELNTSWVKNWRVGTLEPIPLLQIRDYFGEKIALYVQIA